MSTANEVENPVSDTFESEKKTVPPTSGKIKISQIRADMDVDMTQSQADERKRIQIEKLKSLFAVADEDGDGEINSTEFAKLLHEIG